MDKKVIPFPAPAPEEKEPVRRLVLRIGKQRVVFEISCKATVLENSPVPTPDQPDKKTSDGRKRQKGPKR